MGLHTLDISGGISRVGVLMGRAIQGAAWTLLAYSLIWLAVELARAWKYYSGANPF